jgi:4-amino-4-deoxy-L-arabinose transferase-like glycosyltransferase
MYAYNLRHLHTYSSEVGYLDGLKSSVTPDAVRTPGYPLFLSIFVDALPTQNILKNILIVQMIISMVTVFFSFLLFQNFLNKPSAVAASLLVALSPHLIVMNSYILTETLFCFILVLVGFSMSLFLHKPSIYLAIVVGCVVGLSSLIRPSMQFFPIPLALFFMFHLSNRKKSAAFILLMLLGFALTFSPWIIRNVKTLGIISDNRLMINFLHHGIYPDFTYEKNAESFGFPYRYDARSDEIGESAKSVLKEMVRRFRSEPLKHLKWFILKKPMAFWSWNMVQGRNVFVYKVTDSPYFFKDYFKWTYYAMYVLHLAIVLLCLLGSLIAWLPISMIDCPEKAIYVARFVSMLLIYFTAIHMIGAPFSRYSIPLRPFLYGMALFPPYLFFISLKK